MTNPGRSPRVVIVGNGMAGTAVVEALLKLKADPAVTLFGDEPHPSYNRILLSDVLAGKILPEKIFLNKKEWCAERGIDLRLGAAVTSIDPDNKSVTDATGATTPYDFLVLAVGGHPFLPPIQGYGKRGIFVFRTLDDTRRIIETARTQGENSGAFQGGMEGIVIGGGLLGLEAARGLINYGLSVTVVHLADRLMEQQLDPAGASLLKREMERMGIRILLNDTPDEFIGEDRLSAVRLKSGNRLAAGLAMICAGIRPNLDLAGRAGLKVGKGILVDDRMETSVPGIFAVGDAIEHRGRTYGLVAPLREQAAVLADQIVGEGKGRYHGTVCATTLKVAGVDLTSAGEFIGAGAEEISFLDTQKSIYKKCVIRQNRLVGFILLGDNRDGARLFNLVQKGEEISAIKQSLLGNVAVEAGASAGGIASLSDTDLVCNCNGVTKGAILSAILQKGLKSREEVATCTQATTGCGSCSQLVDDLLQEGRRPAPLKSSSSPLPIPSLPDPLGADAGARQKAGPASLKTLDLEKIKQEGLGVDFAKITEIGTRALAPEDYYRLKTYGFCSQKHPGYFMLRIRIPGGMATSDQLLHLAEMADTHGRGVAHLTVRQDLELHWVRVEEALNLFGRLESIGLTTRSACGHTLRNVVACPHGAVAPDGILDVQPWAKRITDYFVTRSDLINPTMPNRLNVYFAGCAECAPDAMINDIGFVTVGRLTGSGVPEIGFELWVGGSLGAHPILGFKLREFIPLSEALPACQAIFAIHTKFGNRNKAKSRLKYLIEQWGEERFAAMFEKVFLEKRSLAENREAALPDGAGEERKPGPVRRLAAAMTPAGFYNLPDGALSQRQPGYLRLTVDVLLGEIRAEQLSALAHIARRHGNGTVHFTKEQNVELHWVPARRLRRTEQALKQAGLSIRGRRGRILACPGTEFCTLAVTDAQGAARDLLDRFRPDGEKGALFRSISIHISGCPNSCAKHQVADIGLAGTLTAVGDLRRFSYQLFLGGRVEGGVRLGEMVRKGITPEMVVPTVSALLNIVLENRLPGEDFDGVVAKLGASKIAALLEKEIAVFLPEAPEWVPMILNTIEVQR